jgi:hypothetical protein
MKIEIILRTHDQSNIHKDRERYCDMPKKELILGCLSSLINSANVLANNHEVNFKILDDHSSPELIQSIHWQFEKSWWPYELYSLIGSGHQYSGLKQFEFAKNSKADLVYIVEDDYLHHPWALLEMVESHELFVNKTGREVVIYPFDMPDDYVPPWMEPCFVVHGSRRHWRTGTWTTFTMMSRPKMFNDHWPVFEKLGSQYDGENVHEGNTICEIWKNHVLRFSPIQSLAMHMQFDTQKDPYIDWKKWWEEYTNIIPMENYVTEDTYKSKEILQA